MNKDEEDFSVKIVGEFNKALTPELKILPMSDNIIVSQTMGRFNRDTVKVMTITIDEDEDFTAFKHLADWRNHINKTPKLPSDEDYAKFDKYIEGLRKRIIQPIIKEFVEEVDKLNTELNNK
jgi:hypothetical protein